ncbi:MAG: hypothetical protein IMX00_00855 [Limnochordales bacterium]|nr:hypothetical protein [Limnochordales bacterium]
MRQDLAELVEDPIFQLNAMLWLVQPLPRDFQALGIRPLLYEQGFSVYAIAPLLAAPPDLRLAMIRAGVAFKERVRPDVVLEGQGKFAITECKKSSFGSESSNRDQMHTLLAISGPRLAEVLGEARERVKGSMLVTVLPEPQRSLFTETLGALQAELRSIGCPAGDWATLGLKVEQERIALVFDSRSASFFGFEPGGHFFLRVWPDTDPRPLYFIPYDPDVEQSPAERNLCRRILLERILASLIRVVGRSTPPCEIRISCEDLLRDATLGVYEFWENRDSAVHMRRLCKHFIRNLAQEANQIIPEALTYVGQDQVWLIKVADEGQHQSLLQAMMEFSAEHTQPAEIEQIPLFDDLG